jgi:hypothetical protein
MTDDEREMNENKKKVRSDGYLLTDSTGLFALPTSIMKVICPRSIPRQRALSAFSDTVFGTGTIFGTSTWLSRSLPLLYLWWSWLLLLLLLLLLRWTRLHITDTIPIGHHRGWTWATATAATEHVAPTGIAK